VTPVFLDAKDVKRYTRDRSVECWSANNAGVSSVRTFRSEHAHRRKRRGLEIQPFGYCWIETVLRKKYVEIMKEKGRCAGALRRSFGHRMSGRGCAGAFPLQR